MLLLLLALAALGLFILAGVARHLQARLRAHGIHALAWRLVTGEAWHGKAITDRGWTRPGRRTLTQTGYAHRRWYLPRWQHALWRLQWILAALLTCVALLVQPRRTTDYLAVTALAGTGYGGVRARTAIQNWTHHHTYVKPLHARLAGAAGIPVAARPQSWLEVPRDRTFAVLTWPRGSELPKPQEREQIASVAAATLGMGDARPTWQLTGPRLKLKLTLPVPAPAWVGLDRIEWDRRAPAGVPQDAIRLAIRDASMHELVLGIGRDGRVVKLDLQQDSPHIALSVDTGRGKSVLVRCIVPQILARGGIAAILDNKLVSHPSLRGLPNVAYADDIAKIHDFLCWLDDELTRRAEYIRDHMDLEGNIDGSPGPPLFVIMEEQNLMRNRLASYWAAMVAADRALDKEVRKFLSTASPAVQGFENASYVGRELGVHLVFISQRFTAEAAGGGGKGAAVRMNTGIRILAGYDDATWTMLVGKGVPMPPPSRLRGRMQVHVKGGDTTEVQVAFFTHAEARAYAEQGGVRVPRDLRYLTEFRVTRPADPRPAAVVLQGRVIQSGSDGAAVVTGPPELPPPVQNLMTLRQAKEAGWVPKTWTNPAGAFSTLKYNARAAGRPVPAVKGKRGTQALYDAVELADFLEAETTRR